MSNTATATITHAAYMKTGTFEGHHAYFSQAATPSLIKRVVDCIGAERIAKSTDRYFNDLNDNRRQHSTDNWRDCVTIDEACAFNNLTETYPAHVTACSDSDRVCIAKAAARVWLQENKLSHA